MGDVKVVLNREGVRELLLSQWAADCCMEAAEAVAQRCGDEYETSLYKGRNRVNVSGVVQFYGYLHSYFACL